MESVAVNTSRSGVSDQIRKAAACRARPWAFLSPELLADVCARLHDAADFVRFHAVCAPWRDAAPSMRSPEAPAHTFLPWLVSQSHGRIVHSPVIYSGQRVSTEPIKPKDRHHRGYNGIVLREPDATGRDTNLVGSADGRSAWIFVGDTERTTLFDLVSRKVTALPAFRIDDQEIDWPMDNPPGIVYGDGTKFLYSFESEASGGNYYNRHRTTFKAAILRPGDTAWTVVEARLDIPAVYHSCAAYRGGKVLVWVGSYFWCVVTPDFEASSTQITDAMLETTWDRLENEYYERDHSYVLESHGELLWASVLVERRRHDYNARLAMRVHALEEEADGSGKMHWVEKDDLSLGDRVLFLGSPASFAANAAELGVDGGCAYFVFRSCVFRYSFIAGEAKPVEWMCPGRGSNKARLWLRPQQPRIAPIVEIQQRLETQDTKKPD